MSYLSTLRNKAKLCLDEIFVTPLTEDVGTQTDFSEEPLKNVIRKRKAEFWDIFESVCGEDTLFSRHVTVNAPGSKGFKGKRPEEGGIGSISDIENSPETPCSVPSCSGTVESTAAATADVPTRQRKKLMREIAAVNGIEYNDDTALNTLFRGQTNDQLIAQLDEGDQKPPAAAVKSYTMNYEDMMEFGIIEVGVYETLDKEMRRKYCAGIMDEVYRLIDQYKAKPTSLRAIATKYNCLYDHLYDIWRGRANNPFLTVSRPTCIQNLR